jgi:hypothetical protein
MSCRDAIRDGWPASRHRLRRHRLLGGDGRRRDRVDRHLVGTAGVRSLKQLLRQSESLCFLPPERGLMISAG